MDQRSEATARVMTALDNGDVPTDADLIICEPAANTRNQLATRATVPNADDDYPLPAWIKPDAIQRAAEDGARRVARRARVVA